MAVELSSAESRIPFLGNETIIDIRMHGSGKSAVTGSLRCLEGQLGNKLYSGHS